MTNHPNRSKAVLMSYTFNIQTGEPMTVPQPGTAEYAKALAVAQKIERMAAEPVQRIMREMRLIGLQPAHQRIVLEAMARKALTEAAALPAD